MFVFVVLHYQSGEMTCECVSSILNTFIGQQFRVVIVDNGSTNGSGRDIREKYKNEPLVDVIRIEVNQGFARGNNCGYKYAKEHYQPNFIFLVSNDVIISDSETISKIEKIYDETHFAVFGPDILSRKTGLHQNPVSSQGLGKDILIRSVIWRTALYPIYLLRTYIRTKKHEHTTVFVQRNDDYKERRIDYVMFGACYVYSKDYIHSEEYAMNPNTYLYMEEWLLHYYCQTHNYRMVYDPSIQVLHYEDVDTNRKSKKLWSKAVSTSRESLRSSYVLLGMMKNEQVR